MNFLDILLLRFYYMDRTTYILILSLVVLIGITMVNKIYSNQIHFKTVMKVYRSLAIFLIFLLVLPLHKNYVIVKTINNDNNYNITEQVVNDGEYTIVNDVIVTKDNKFKDYKLINDSRTSLHGMKLKIKDLKPEIKNRMINYVSSDLVDKTDKIIESNN